MKVLCIQNCRTYLENSVSTQPPFHKDWKMRLSTSVESADHLYFAGLAFRIIMKEVVLQPLPTKNGTVAHAHHRESGSAHTKFHWTCTVDGVRLVGHNGWSAFLHQMQCQVGVLLIGMANSTLVVDGQHLLFKYIRREWMKRKCCQLGDHKQEKIQTCDIGKKLADDMCYLCFLSFMAECLVFRPPTFHLKCEDKNHLMWPGNCV